MKIRRGDKETRRRREFFFSASPCLRVSASLLLCLALRCVAAAPAEPDPDAAATVVVFNELDCASVNLAGYYAQKRGIPFDHLVGLSCAPEETIPRAEYDKTIAEPLRKAFLRHGWWKTEAGLVNGRVAESKIRFVALIRGIPLKIAPLTSPYEGDKAWTGPAPLNHNEAAVDSELALLGLHTQQISGPVDNPVFRNSQRSPQTPPPWLLLVCRLDAADPATVRRMIDDSLATEKTGLWGFAYVDSRGISGGGMGEGDQWIRNVAADAIVHGIPCVQDTGPALFPDHYPMSRAALYFGWYAGEVEGPFKDKSCRFVPGAVAVHLHSFSAGSLRQPLRGWCAPLLEQGAAATLGNVYEPYLSLTPHLDIFEEQLRTGTTFAEAAYAAQAALSWMTTFIGDPLYRPFKSQGAAKISGAAVEYAAYRTGASRWAAKGRAEAEPLLKARGKALKSGVIFEGLGLLQAGDKDPAAALISWKQAQNFYKADADRIRCALHVIAVLREAGKTGQALAVTRDQINRFPQADATARLRAVELELAPPVASPLPPGSEAGKPVQAGR